MNATYNEKFYDDNLPGSSKSASTILPIIIDLFKPASMLDIGCGTGVWLRVAQRLGVDEICGVDGDWARQKIVVSADSFYSHDLSTKLDLKRRFDLAISLEVAEHISADYAALFVDNLVRHSDLVLFGAAIPYQGGTHHINEQWPNYWIKLFDGFEWRCFDFVRGRVWDDDDVEPWYRQNTFLFVAKSRKDLLSVAENAAAEGLDLHMLPLVQPAQWQLTNDRLNAGMWSKTKELLHTLRKPS